VSKFIEVLTHGRKLQGAVKTLSIVELEGVSRKLESIIKRRKIKDG
jgi:DNA-binding protein H-NS